VIITICGARKRLSNNTQLIKNLVKTSVSRRQGIWKCRLLYAVFVKRYRYNVFVDQNVCDESGTTLVSGKTSWSLIVGLLVQVERFEYECSTIIVSRVATLQPCADAYQYKVAFWGMYRRKTVLVRALSRLYIFRDLGFASFSCTPQKLRVSTYVCIYEIFPRRVMCVRTYARAKYGIMWIRTYTKWG